MNNFEKSDSICVGENEELLGKGVQGGWLRSNWCLVLRVLLAVIGITVPLVMFLKPCQEVEIVAFEMQVGPLDLYILMDASGSMVDDWETELLCAVNLTNIIVDSDISGVRIAAGQFSTGGWGIVNYTDNITLALSKINGAEQIVGGTDYEEGLKLFLATWEVLRNPYAQSILIMISDGEPDENEEDGMHYSEMAALIRNTNNVSIMGVMVTDEDDGDAERALQSVSSCANSTDLGNCTWYSKFDDFETFVSHTKEMGSTLANSVVPVTVETRSTNCLKGPWLGFLALLLPLLMVLILPYCISLKRRIVILRPPKPQPEFYDTVKQPPMPSGDSLVQKSMPSLPKLTEDKNIAHHKWRVLDTTHRSYSALVGTTPTIAPVVTSSSPRKSLTLKNKKSGRLVALQEPVITRKLENGYVEEEYEENRTLEQWSEDTANRLCKFCLSCFSSRDGKNVDHRQTGQEITEMNNGRKNMSIVPVRKKPVTSTKKRELTTEWTPYSATKKSKKVKKNVKKR